jgi:selenium metabolism protein YedF
MIEKNKIDCRGLACPQPVIDTKEALSNADGPIEVIVDNEAASTNVSRFAQSRGARVSVVEQEGEFHLTIEPGDGNSSGEAPPIVCGTDGVGKTVVCVSSEGMGRGDDGLGQVLMAAFLDTLAQFKDEISHLIFLNAGVKLTVADSKMLEQLQQMEQVGAKILVCGTCLNHFGIQDSRAVGTVSNMYEIVDTLTKAGRVIRP